MIREMISTEAASVEEVFAASPGASRWTALDLVELAQKGIRIWVAEQDGQIVGACAARTVTDEVEVLNLAVATSCRKRGVGRELMGAALGDANQSGAARAFLEVRESNSEAQAFYSALGFTKIGRRRAYYRDPSEDALVMSRPLDE